MSNNLTILVVDDDARNIFALSAVLKTHGYRVLPASGMPEAFQLLEAEPVDIILLDMMMPEMDGYEALPLLKNNPRFTEIPVIAVTAQAMPGDREKTLDAGADGYVSKPVDIDLLKEMIETTTK